MAKDADLDLSHRSRIPRLLPPEKRHIRSLSAPTKFEEIANLFKEKIEYEQQQKRQSLRKQRLTRNGSMRELHQGRDVYGVMNGQKAPLKEILSSPNLVQSASSKPPLPGYKKRSAGRDKANPLPPLTQSNTQHSKLNSGYISPNGLRSGSANSVSNEENYLTNKPPFLNRPKMARPHRLNSRGSEIESGTDSDMASKTGLTPLERAKLHKIKKREQNNLNHFESSDDEGSRPCEVLRGKPNNEPRLQNGHMSDCEDKDLTDFQKWQREQERAKQERLENYRNKNSNPSSQRSNSAQSQKAFGNTYSVPADQSPSPSRRFSPASKKHHVMAASPSSSKPPTHATAKQALMKAQKLQMLNRQRSQKNVNESSSDDDDNDEDDCDEENDEAVRKQRELEELIAKQEEALEKMQREREAEAEREQREAERQRKRNAAGRDRKRRLQEAEEQERLKRQEDHRRRMVDEVAPPRQVSRQSSRNDSRQSQRPRKGSVTVPALRRPSLPPKKEPPKAQTPELNDNTAFYFDMAATEEARPDDGLTLQPCPSCGRRFATERLAKHTKVCKTNTNKKPRKKFDMIKQRIQGTEQAQFVDPRSLQNKPKPKPKKKDWRAQHEDFISTIRYAKKMQETEAKGGNVAALPPPPASLNPDYVQCPHCNRKFNPSAADRHIPLCQNIKSRPAPPKAKSKRY